MSSIPPELIWAKMEAKKSMEAYNANAASKASTSASTSAKPSAASIYSVDTAYSYDKDSLAKPSAEKRSLGTKIKKILK